MRPFVYTSAWTVACLMAASLCGCTRFRQQVSSVPLTPTGGTEASFDVARLHEKQGAFERAVLGYQDLIRQTPNNPAPLHRLGVIAIHQGALDEADEFFSRAQELAPPDAEFLTDLGYLRYLQNRMEAAEQVLREALGKSPGHQRALNNLGIVLASEGKESEALLAFSQATEPAEAHTSLGFILAQNGDIEKAKFHLSKALDHDPEHRRAAHGLVQIAREFGVDLPAEVTPHEPAITEEQAAHNSPRMTDAPVVTTSAPDPFSFPLLEEEGSYTDQLLARLSNGPTATGGGMDLFQQVISQARQSQSEPEKPATRTMALNELHISTGIVARDAVAGETTETGVILAGTQQLPRALHPPDDCIEKPTILAAADEVKDCEVGAGMSGALTDAPSIAVGHLLRSETSKTPTNTVENPAVVENDIVDQLVTVLEYGNSFEQMQAIRDIALIRPNSDRIKEGLKRLAGRSSGEIQRLARTTLAALSS